MTDQEQNIIVAEACGWKKVGHEGNELCGYPPSINLRTLGTLGRNIAIEVVPDYGQDLNAMQGAVFSKNESFAARFEENLQKLASLRGKYIHQLTAEDWREAFIRTIGKWRDA